MYLYFYLPTRRDDTPTAQYVGWTERPGGHWQLSLLLFGGIIESISDAAYCDTYHCSMVCLSACLSVCQSSLLMPSGGMRWHLAWIIVLPRIALCKVRALAPHGKGKFGGSEPRSEFALKVVDWSSFFRSRGQKRHKRDAYLVYLRLVDHALAGGRLTRVSGLNSHRTLGAGSGHVRPGATRRTPAYLSSQGVPTSVLLRLVLQFIPMFDCPTWN